MAAPAQKQNPTPAQPLTARTRLPGRPARAAPERGAGRERGVAPQSLGTGAAPLRLRLPGPLKDPRFQRVVGKLQHSAARTTAHPPPSRKAAEASAAALPPPAEKLAGAKAVQVDSMQQADTGKPEPSSFLELLRAEIARVMPTNLGETEHFMQGGQKEQMKSALSGNVAQQKDQSASGLKDAAGAAPDPASIPGKPVTPLPAPDAPVPPPIGAPDAMPASRPAAEISLEKSNEQAGQALSDNHLTGEQLQKANDPRFSAVLDAKAAVQTQAASGPLKFRGEETRVLTQAGAGAAADEKKGLGGLFGVRGRSNTAVLSRQQAAKAREEAERKRVAADIEAIYGRTRQAVEGRLAGLDQEVNARFDQGVEQAMRAMTAHIDRRMDDWKFDRYVKWPWGPARWLKDKLMGLPDEVNVFYDEGRKIFTAELDRVIVGIANLVENRLQQAKDDVTRGQQEIHAYVERLPKNLKEVGQAAEKDMGDRFAELRQGIDDKKNDLAQGLAQRYQAAMEQANQKLKEMQEENKGLLRRLADKIGEVIKILRDFKNKVLSLLRKAASVIEEIVADPIGFLKNLLSAIKKGIGQFVDNIWTHIKAGLLQWLFGSLADAGITLPADFSLGSILKLVLQVLGITYDRIRAKAVKLIGERNVTIIEKAFELLRALWEGGPAALWEKVKEFLGDLKTSLMDAIQDWLVTTIIKQAVIKLVSMFNPAGAIIQAILMIYNTVMFLVENINRIMEFVTAVVDSVAKIAAGDIGAAANWIEKAMARTIPLIIGFLARLLGLSGLADKIIGFIKRIQAKVDQAIDKVISKIVGGIGKLFGRGKEKAGEKSGPKSAEETRWDLAVTGIHSKLEKLEAQGLTEKDLDGLIPAWKKEYGFKELTVKPGEEEFEIDGSMSPGRKVASAHKSGTKKNPFRLEWPKPASERYTPLYLGGKVSQDTSQSVLKGLHHKGFKDSTGTKVEEFLPNQRKQLSGGEMIGLADRYRVNFNTIVGPLTQNTTPKGEKLLRILRQYGYRAQKIEHTAADHVREVQFGGDDDVKNLWPLDESVNSAAGPTLAGARVKYPTSGKEISIADLKKKTGAKYYFRITKVAG